MTPEEIRNISLSELLEKGEFECACGKKHAPGVKKVFIEAGAVKRLPGLVKEFGGTKVFIVSGHDTYAAAGDAVTGLLSDAGIPFTKYVFPVSPVKPTEFSVGAAVMHFDYSCDFVVGVGSGVINDVSKILAKCAGLPYISVATAPSVDGYVSCTSSMEMDGLKISLPSRVPDVVIGDLDILTKAPMKLLVSGVGDMAAKIISLKEWRLAKLIVGEYYCPVVSAMMENALNKVLGSAEGLKNREPEAVKTVMEGLIIAGMAMNYADVTRPASGMEHYFSHIWDMRSLAFPECQVETHGNQAGLGALYTLKLWDYIAKHVIPDREKALKAASEFSVDEWNEELLKFIGPGANAMIENEKRDGKYAPEKHEKRLEIILSHWDEIVGIITEPPHFDEVYAMMADIGAPLSARDFGYTEEEIKTTMKMTKDIRDKYVTTRILWDLGELDSVAEKMEF